MVFGCCFECESNVKISHSYYEDWVRIQGSERPVLAETAKILPLILVGLPQER
ncbi:hypothetical protein Pan153_10560 [Gimesia panareensis]|uniref:Uncharacterized protein n=1 Tax=Gimesia panareensis TaxID=2527978 RepID=A0A518FJA7_9PLAN|nr:hypothetical protein Pan153_10560 [Gimesia panareensis]